MISHIFKISNIQVPQFINELRHFLIFSIFELASGEFGVDGSEEIAHGGIGFDNLF